MKHNLASKIVVLSILLALIFGATGTAPTQAAGPYTHSWFAEMAIEKLKDLDGMTDKDYSALVTILNKYPGVVNYGALFPDMGYALKSEDITYSIFMNNVVPFVASISGIYALFPHILDQIYSTAGEPGSDWAEDMHDNAATVHNFCAYYTFLHANGYTDSSLQTYKKFYLDDAESDNPAFEHQTPAFRQALITQLLPSIHHTPRTEQDEKKIAFLFGLISHQEADTPFHAGMYDDGCSGKSGVITSLINNPYVPDAVEHPLKELQLDYLLFGYDARAGLVYENNLEYQYYSDELKQIIRAASSATQDMTPAPPPKVCTVIIPPWWLDPDGLIYCTEDRFDTAQNRMIAMIGNILQTGKNTPPDDGLKNSLVNDSRGGIIDGAELTAVVWAKTWNDLMKDYSAPVTALSLTPQQPDGNNGWYRIQPVTVALNATGALQPFATQYRDGDNPLQQYSVPFAITTEGVHQLYYFSTNSQGMVEAANNQVIKIDLTPPTLSGAATTLPNGNGWYNTAVTVYFKAEDWSSGVDTLSPDQTITTEGAGQAVVGNAVDLAGNTVEITVGQINIDKTAPVVNVTVDKDRYTKIKPFTVHFSGSDTLSGLNTLTAEFNGQAVTDGQAIDLFWLPLGTHTLTVSAEDLAGNVTEVSQSIELTATLESLKETLARLCKDGEITKSGTCNDLSAKLDAAIAAHNRGNDKTAMNILNAFQNAVKAQSGKAITERAAQLLLLDSVYVLADLNP